MIAVVVPTCRPLRYLEFVQDWKALFHQHDVRLITVFDGDDPYVKDSGEDGKTFELRTIMGDYEDCITNHNGGVRNLGFAYVAKFLPDVETIITLDDDVIPMGDPIQDHLDILDSYGPTSWMPTCSEFTRGFPYAVREESEIVLSHGVWDGVADWDAPTQLVLGEQREVTFSKAIVPKGVLFPMCIMNVAFKRKLLPYMYQAPAAPDLGVGRMDDIFCGILCKREMDKLNWAAATGYSVVYHTRASNVFENLKKEALGIQLNETFWQGDESHPYFAGYRAKLDHWQMFIKSCE